MFRLLSLFKLRPSELTAAELFEFVFPDPPYDDRRVLTFVVLTFMLAYDACQHSRDNLACELAGLWHRVSASAGLPETEFVAPVYEEVKKILAA